jgi:hypothetical protein
LNIFKDKDKENINHKSPQSNNSNSKKNNNNNKKQNGSNNNVAEKITHLELYSIIKEFIPHFANFNFEISEAIDMIVEIATKYKVTEDKIGYFVTFLNSSIFTVKSRMPNKRILPNRKRTKSVSNKMGDLKVGIIQNCIDYLNGDDLLNMIILNKNYHSKMTKKIYKKLLTDPKLDISKRLQIWKNILNVVKNIITLL